MPSYIPEKLTITNQLYTFVYNIIHSYYLFTEQSFLDYDARAACLLELSHRININ